MYNGTVVLSQGRCTLSICDEDRVRLKMLSMNEHVYFGERQATCRRGGNAGGIQGRIIGIRMFARENDIIIDKSVSPVQNRPRKVAYAPKDDLQKKIASLEEQQVASPFAKQIRRCGCILILWTSAMLSNESTTRFQPLRSFWYL